MDYVSPEKARELPGLRLALTAGVPGPWSEAAKAIFHVKRIDYTPVLQAGGEDNEALVAWTGHRNAPIAIYEHEPARVRWEEILALAERLAPEPALTPADERERALMMGMAHALCSEDGLGWNRRHQLLAPMLSAAGAADNPAFAAVRVLGRDYGWSEAALKRADERVCSILRFFSEQLAQQHDKDLEYLVGDRLTAIDLYWATFCALLRPLDDDVCPMPEGLRAGYGAMTPAIEAALDPALIAHRDLVYQRHLPLPLDF